MSDDEQAKSSASTMTVAFVRDDSAPNALSANHWDGRFVQPAGVAPQACDDGSIIRGYWTPKGAVMSKTWQENAGLLVLRAGLGGVLVAHGVQKLFGWLGGH